MSRLLGYMSTRPDRLRDALLHERAALGAQDMNFDGWGIGFYQGGEVLHIKRPQTSGGEFDWAEIAADVRSHCVIGHRRHATVGDFRVENTHPFRMRQWLFAHTGTVEGFPQIRAELMESMPDFIRRNIRGETDSELIFHAILSYLHERGEVESLEATLDGVVAAIRDAVARLDQLSAKAQVPAGTLNLLLTNGRHMFALRRGSPMMYVERQGISHEVKHVGEPEARTSVHPPPRYVLILNNGAELPPDYSAIDDNSILVVDRDLHVSTIHL